MDRLPEDEVKRIMKEALKEWLDEQFAKFGRWSFYSLVTISFSAVMYLYLIVYGAKKAGLN